MHTDFFGGDLPVSPLLFWPVFFVAVGVAGYVFGYLFRVLLLKFTGKTSNQIDDIVIASFGWPLNMVIGIITVSAVAQLSSVPREYAEHLSLSNSWVKVLLIFLAIIGTMRFIRLWIDWLAKDNKALGHSIGILKPLFSIVVLAIGTLVILTEFEIDILPLLTGLGVGGVAVALALQAPLSNFFAGVTLVSDRQVRQGDFIQLESGLEGWVRSIGWRSTLVETREHKIVIIPNLKLSESILTNFHLPKSWIVVPIDVGVSYSSDPEKVREVVLEEVDRLTEEYDFFLKDPAPTIRFNPGFGESSLDFTLRVAIQNFEHLFEARDLVRRRLFARFRKEGIEIPFPQRDLHIKTPAPLPKNEP